MSGAFETVAINARWELTRLVRSQRVWLLAIPPLAGTVGSAVADLYLRIPSAATAVILGLLVTAGLAAMVLLDLTALAVGEDLGLRAHLLIFPLPQGRSAALTGRLLIVVVGCLGAYLLGAAAVWSLGGTLVVAPAAGTIARPPLFVPWHLLVAVPALLVFLAGVTAVAARITQRSSEAIVAGVLAGVVGAGGAGYLLAQGELTLVFPALLLLAGVGALVATVVSFPGLVA
jgi:hypothetical protein